MPAGYKYSNKFYQFFTILINHSTQCLTWHSAISVQLQGHASDESTEQPLHAGHCRNCCILITGAAWGTGWWLKSEALYHYYSWTRLSSKFWTYLNSEEMPASNLSWAEMTSVWSSDYWGTSATAQWPLSLRVNKVHEPLFPSVLLFCRLAARQSRQVIKLLWASMSLPIKWW